MDIQDLLSERQIYRNLVTFAQAMDERQWHLLDDITTEGVRAELGTGPIEGREALVTLMRQYLDNCGTTQHLLGNVIINIEGETASSSAYVADLHLGTEGKEELTFRTLGIYKDRWQRAGDKWLLCERIKENRGIVGTMEVFGSPG
jgi:hypothetical protein